MKSTARHQKGSALIISLIVIIIFAGASAAFLSISTYRNREAVMSREYVRAFYAAEAGVSASIGEIIADCDYDSNGKGNVTGSFNEGTYSVSAVDEGNEIWTLTSTGTYSGYSRELEVVVGPKTTIPWENAAFGGTSVSAGGISLLDSYDSDVGTYASQVSGDHAGENGNIGSNGSITASGTADVYGDATPGPDDSVTIGGSATISGSTAPAEEERELEPYVYTPVGSSLGQLNSTTTLSSGTYRYDSIKLASWDNVTLGTAAGDIITVYVDGSIGVSANAKITIFDGATVVMHHGTDTVSFSGNGLVNTSETPSDFIFYSATTAAVKLTGNSDFYGAVYAPNAPVTAIGTNGFYGAVVGDTVSVSGTGDMHYDEALGRIQIVIEGKYTARSWRELTP